MTVCPHCHYRHVIGLPSWDDCLTCAIITGDDDKVRALSDINPHLRFSRRIPKRQLQRAPGDDTPYSKSPSSEYPHSAGIDEYKKNGEHWPDGSEKVAFEYFNDFTYSPELRAQMREQVEFEYFSMTDDEWFIQPPPTKSKRKRRGSKAPTPAR